MPELVWREHSSDLFRPRRHHDLTTWRGIRAVEALVSRGWKSKGSALAALPNAPSY